MQLCLGTVQFGLKYGIMGNKQPDFSECIEMLDYAYQNGINSFDTAPAYGIAEEVLGAFIKQKAIKQSKINIVSKTSTDLFKEENRDNWFKETKESILDSLKKLNIDYLDGYMLHNASKIYEEETIEILLRLKKEGYVKKVGASIYKPDEAIKTFTYNDFEIIQIPYNIFDQRLDKGVFFSSQLIKNRSVYARSTFLQGLLLMETNEIPEYLYEAIPLVKRFDELCRDFGISRSSAAICHVKNNKNIDYLVFGIDNLAQLREFIKTFNTDVKKHLVTQIAKEFTQVSDKIVMPFMWNK